LFEYYFTYLESLKKTVELQSDLESGKIVLFGSSELGFPPNDACSNHAGVATYNLLQFKFSTFTLNKILYKLNDLLNI